MSKKKVPRHFSFVAILFFVSIMNTNFSFSQETEEKSICYILADAKKIPLFITLSDLRKKILVSRDIEYLGTSVFLYTYDDRIMKTNGYVITPQILFFVDTTKRIIKEELYCNIERKATSGDIRKEDLKILFEIIRKRSIPFAVSPENPDFASAYRHDSPCNSYSIEISKVKDEYSNKKWQQCIIKISVEK